MQKAKLKNLKFKNRMFLAPMLEPNDIAFRLLCKKAGCALTFTGMISPLSKQKLELDDKPIVQIFSNNSKGLTEFIKKYDKNVSGWDFNLGCPSKLSQRLSYGAFMHEDIESIKNIFGIIRESTKKPCFVKLRKSENAIKIAKIAEEIGFYCVTIHPRTIKQGYGGKADYDFALKLKKEIKIPVCYSGDVNIKNAKEILNDFEYIMIGRSAIGNPNIFNEINHGSLKKKIIFKDYLKLAKRYKLYFRQIKFQSMNFTKGEKNAKELRKKLILCKSGEEIEKVFKF